ncbi:hypothetical protein J0X19_18720 [Hymenobacter sp. BT186]|uniref:Uncharacterized protein n=1 Tax=Hymenobacter telluris TaxID=2816474 RepID=A0A939EZG5_9BACT|nr:hypothetical protein [Hymenobacter telluris]MBO0360001.1 hypothetical protein [Hymenobacter telluris]MBW3376028.1 hypothetical protein [Hymenobacter norwichensis]
MLGVLLNLNDYTPYEHVCFAVGCFLWVIVYIFTIRSIRRNQFVDIPLISACANISWEFLWSWVFTTDMGELYVWGYRIWFFLDCYIVYGLFRYGYKQILIPALARKHQLVTTFGIVAWLVMLYFYIKLYDAPLSHMGAYSGYILSILMGTLYITLFLSMNNTRLFSYASVWCAGLGNLLVTLFCFSHFTDWFLLSMCVFTTILNAAYILIFASQRKPAAHELSTA